MAQEVEAIFPALVTEVDGHKAVYYHKLGPVLLEALRELAGQNEALRRRNDELFARIERLEKRLSPGTDTDAPPEPADD
ncbi:MAG: hypothetical protein QM820_46875 [Minicystis sp.]